MIGTGDNKKRNQDGGNGWGKRRELHKHLGSKGKKSVSDWTWMVKEKEASGVSPTFSSGCLGSQGCY